MDPLGAMQLAASDYRVFGEALRAAAARHCPGRLVAVHEGGYSELYGAWPAAARKLELCLFVFRFCLCFVSECVCVCVCVCVLFGRLCVFQGEMRASP
jgi:hypothetical protein